MGLTIYVKDARHDAAIATADATKDKAEGFVRERDRRITELDAANAGNQDVVRDLQNRLAEAVGQQQATDKINRDAVAARDAARRERDTALAKLNSQREHDYATDPTCADWARRPVCGAISRSLRDQWEAARARTARP